LVNVGADVLAWIGKKNLHSGKRRFGGRQVELGVFWNGRAFRIRNGKKFCKRLIICVTDFISGCDRKFYGATVQSEDRLLTQLLPVGMVYIVFGFEIRNDGCELGCAGGTVAHNGFRKNNPRKIEEANK